MLLRLETNSAQETEQLGQEIGKLLQPGDVIALNGSLGAGKTCLVRGMARGMGVVDRVSSPTFTLINEYDGDLPLYHMDMYRLAHPEELEDLGYEEYFYGSGVTVLEWASQVEPYLPGVRLDVLITKVTHREDEADTRVFELVPRGERFEQMLKELKHRVCFGH